MPLGCSIRLCHLHPRIPGVDLERFVLHLSAVLNCLLSPAMSQLRKSIAWNDDWILTGRSHKVIGYSPFPVQTSATTTGAISPIDEFSSFGR